MMHERDERQAPRLVGEQPIEPGQREAVDDDDAAVGEAGERRARRAQRRGRRRAGSSRRASARPTRQPRSVRPAMISRS